jgi:N-acetylglutamate synthase/N-acetylornithine aminotransferase
VNGHPARSNWGRLVAAAGRSGAAFVLDKASVSVGPVAVLPAACRTTSRHAAAQVMQAGN